MWFPKYALKDLSPGSGSIIGRNNIEEFLNHVSKYEKIGEKSLAELAPDYETAMACLVQMVESRFISLNPFLQYMFLKLHEIEDGEKRDFILETLLRKFKHEAIEARKIFEHYNKLGSSIDVIDVLGKMNKVKPDEINIPIPFKLAGLHEAHENNFNWIVHENPFDKMCEPKCAEKGSSKTTISSIQCLVEKISSIDLDDPSLDNT